MRDERDLERRLRASRPAPGSESFKEGLRLRMQAELQAREAGDPRDPGRVDPGAGLLPVAPGWLAPRLAWANGGLALAIAGVLLLGSPSRMPPGAGTLPPQAASAELRSFDTVTEAYPERVLSSRLAVARPRLRIPALPPGEPGQGKGV